MMFIKPRRLYCALILALTVMISGAWASLPQEALSPKDSQSIYALFNIGNFGNFARYLFSDQNLALLRPLCREGEEEILSLAAAIAKNVSVEEASVLAGQTKEEEPFLQAALSISDSLKAELDRVASCQAESRDVLVLLAGEQGADVLASFVNLTKDKGHYVVNGSLVLSAKDNLLLLSSTPEMLKESLEALDDTDKRLVFTRRFEGRNFVFLNADSQKALDATKAELQKDPEKKDELEKLELIRQRIRQRIQGPIKIESSFERSPDKFTVSFWANVKEFLVPSELEKLKKLQEATGPSLLLMGKEPPLVALSILTDHLLYGLDSSPETQAFWPQLIQASSQFGLTEPEVQALFSESISLVSEGEVTYSGQKLPGLALALKGSKGAAQNVLSKLTANDDFMASFPMSPFEAKGWQTIYQLDPAVMPVPFFMGVRDENLFLGVMDNLSLTGEPEVPKAFNAFRETPQEFGLFVDFKAIQSVLSRLLTEKGFVYDALASELGEAQLNSALSVLSAQLSVPFMSAHTSDDTAYIHFYIEDVPPQEGLWAKLVKVAANLMGANSQ